MGSKTTSPALDHVLVFAPSSEYGFAWGKAKTIHEAKAICKKEGGKLTRSFKVYQVSEEASVNDFGQLTWRNPECTPVLIEDAK